MRKTILSMLSALLLAGVMATIAFTGTAQSRIVDVSASNYFSATAMDDNGSLWKWGGDFYSPIVSVVPGMTGVKETSGKLFYTLALKDDGTVWYMDQYPRSGVPGAFDTIDEPVKIDGVSNIRAISCGADRWLALKDDGTVWAFDEPTMTLVPFMGLSDVRQISQSQDHSVIVRNDGSVVCFGDNTYGQLGNGFRQTAQGAVPDPDSQALNFIAADLHNVTMAAAGWEFTVALTDDGTVWTWGRSSEGRLGDGASLYSTQCRAYPQRVPGLEHIVSIAAGGWSAYALRDDGTVWAWGDNRYYGMLGDGTFSSRSRPVQVTGLSGIVKISVTDMYALALDKYGNVWAWGRDSNGTLNVHGSYDFGFSAIPVLIGFSHALSGPAIEPGWMVPEYTATIVPEEDRADATQNDDSIRYLTISEDNLIYAFKEHELLAYLPDGSLKWSVTIPGRWLYADECRRLISMDETGYGTMLETSLPIFDTADGYVYLYTLVGLPDDCPVTVDRWDGTDPTQMTVRTVEKSLVAVSPDGRIAWTYNLTEKIGVEDLASVTVAGDRIYFYHCYNDTVLDRSGNLVFSLDNIAAPPAVGSDGTVYAFQARKINCMPFAVYVDPITGDPIDCLVPGSVLEAFDGNGRLIWSKDLGIAAVHPYYTPEARRLYGSLPLCSEDCLYIPLEDGVMAMDGEANVLWSVPFDGDVIKPLMMMPMDTDGNLYYTDHNPYGIKLMVVSPDGNITMTSESNYVNVTAGYDGVLYEVAATPASGSGDGDMCTVTIRAFDVLQGSYRWEYTLPLGENHTVLVDSDNVALYFRDTMAFRPIRQGSGYVWADVIPSDRFAYVNFRTAVYDSPVVINETNITYASAIIAIDSQSGIVAQQPLEAYTTAVAANNSTIVYATQGGDGPGIIVVAAAAAGIGLIAAAVLFAKFFMLGTVARARSRLEDNKNRGRVLDFVAANPGATLSEISRDTGMNMGTVRYHVFILELNHKVKPFREGKFIRYFPNSNFYSQEEQLVIAMMRREPIRAIINTLTWSPGQTNSDLSKVLGQSESAVSEHMKILCDRGITVKEKSEDGRIHFSVSGEVQATLGRLHERLDQKGIKPGL
ncbi:MAG: Regulator of chromosome condensation (RCC1) repeat protein [Methanocella sp. PtaU1.Bin125]|nr:MAG: Regulator of chromosome condensation (RCC1) repeat protein [Methanocella sp. PtaU1.Bin125]